MDDFSVNRDVRAGDGFAFVGERDDDTVEMHYSALERMCYCYSGVVYLSYEEDGFEWTEPVPCRRCKQGVE